MASGEAAAANREGFFGRHGLPIGLQLYTLGDAPEQDLDGVLARVAAIGYRTIELPGFYGRTPLELRRALEAAGLHCTSLHHLLTPTADFGKVADAARVIGFDRVIAPIFAFPPGVSLSPQSPGETPQDVIAHLAQKMTAGDWSRQAELLNDSGEALKREGLRMGYHNHNVEFAPQPDGSTGFEILLRETDPSLVGFELDVGWVAAAGRDPLELLAAHGGRFELMHLKDIKATTRPNFALRQDPAEVGSGMLDWRRILPAAYDAGVRPFFVEQEPPFTRDRLESVKLSFDYLDGLAG
jgi:sugar phosphate isomerase/epimerase